MTRKILLVSVNQYALPYHVFPLGISYLASACKNAGYEVKLYDFAIERESFFQTLQEFKPNYVGLSLRNIDDIYLETENFFAPVLYETAKEIRKQYTCKIILGGSGYSLFPDKLLDLTGADFGICGEGEGSLLQLLECLESNLDYESIPGLVFRKNGTININPQRPYIGYNDVLPLRNADVTDYYIKSSLMLNIQTQRGCPYKCCYCTYPLIEGNNIRYRSPDVVCDEIERIIAVGAPYFFVVDSVFNSSPEHVTGICEEIIRRGLTIKWGCYLRPRGLTEPLLQLAARAGLTHIEFGSDSFTDSVLDSYGKNFTFADILHSSECARKAKIHYAHFIIFGGPGETESTMKESFENSMQIKKSVFFPFASMRLYPGTPLFHCALQEGLVSENKDLLHPFYYMNPCISQERATELIIEFSKQAPNWISCTKSVQSQTSMNILRKQNLIGPLWEFLIK